MDRETLKALQAPLKSQYKTSPDAAKICLAVEGIVEFDVPGCRVVIPQNDGRFIKAGLHPNAGGDGTQACSGDLLLQSLVTCAGTTLAAVSISMGLMITQAHVYAKGWLDFRGTMGVDRSAPVGFTGIELLFRIETQAEDAVVRKLIELTERYCVVYQTLLTGTIVNSSGI
ncbi:MAG: OsmC family protein [Planctomycetaceae bacterium]